MTPQNRMVLDALMAGESLTPLDALDRFGVWRLAARIKELRDDGHAIVTYHETSGNKVYARYRLVRHNPDAVS